MTSQTATKTSFQMKGSLFTITILNLFDANLENFAVDLNETIKKSPKFFLHAPVILDLSEVADKIDLDQIKALQKLLREQHLIPVGIRGINGELKEKAHRDHIACFSSNAVKDSAEVAAKGSAAKTKLQTKKEAVTPRTSKIFTTPIRSGQQVYAEGGDLIILGSVSPGAEILADGSIHVYGPLRGRALAGITGNQEARIFCRNLDAELISIAGRYLVSENLVNHVDHEWLQIYLDENHLKIDKL